MPADATGPLEPTSQHGDKPFLETPSANETARTVISSARSKPLGPDAQHAESLIGRRLGHFQLVESVGVGGMAAVIKATDLDLGRTVALKILPPDMATDPENITRFKQEARAAAKLDHENVARVYFCGEDQGLHFIAFEYVEGENLRVRMEKQGGLLTVTDSLHYMIQVTAGLSHAASRGVVHRDIKPSNIIITPEGKAKIVDMGLARNLDTRTSNGQLTQSGVTLGTFDYISPEQALEPRTADCRSDIYSLGCTFYHMLTGRTPVPEGTAAKKLHCHQHVAPLDPRELNPAVTDELAAVLAKMMAKDPIQRYQHPDHLLQHLLMLAEQLHVPTDALKIDGDHRQAAYFDRPLPQPPSTSPFWIAAVVIVFAIGLIGVTGGFSGPRALDSQPFWQNGKTAKDFAGSPAAAKDDGASTEQIQSPAAVKGPQEARNTSELVALLRQPNVHIKLKPNIVYDLTHASRKDAELPQALFEGTDLTLECDRLTDRPTVRLLVAAPDDGKSLRPGSLTIRGPSDGSTARVHLRGIRFECVFSGSGTGPDRCQFIQRRRDRHRRLLVCSGRSKGRTRQRPVVPSARSQDRARERARRSRDPAGVRQGNNARGPHQTVLVRSGLRGHPDAEVRLAAAPRERVRVWPAIRCLACGRTTRRRGGAQTGRN